MTPWHHSGSTAKKYGGDALDYIRIHDWFDETKQFTGDWTHRAMRHHSAGVQWAIEKFGHCITRSSDGKQVPTKIIAEQHIMEDCGFIPTPKDWLDILKKQPSDWMLAVKTKKTTKMETA